MNLKYQTVLRNLQGGDNWKGSFYEQLAEFGRWDLHEFWLLHREITVISREISKNLSRNKDAVFAIITIYQKINNLILSNFDANDEYSILCVDNNDLLAYKERLDLAVLSLFSGEIYPESSFDIMNPLIADN